MANAPTFAMSFAEFAEAVRPTGAVNRFPAVAPEVDVYSYSVYLNGPVAGDLPLTSREHTFKDVTLHALTEKLQLNSLNARDNLKVAELVAVRSSWMTAVLETSLSNGVYTDQVLEDYTLLSDGMTHPWIKAELDKQRELSRKLGATLAHAGVSKDVIPREVSLGVVVAQDKDFTIQKTKEGEVVTHENRRLQALPEVGADIAVTYYRGTGQIVPSLENLKVSEAFIDPVSEDLAVTVEDRTGKTQMVLFNGITSFDRFVKAHDLEPNLVQKAMAVRAATPKTVQETPKRTLSRPPFIDGTSGCLAVDYNENNVVYTAIFASATEMASLAAEFDLGAKAIAGAFTLEEEQRRDRPLTVDSKRNAVESETMLRGKLAGLGYRDPEPSASTNKQYAGRIVAVSTMHVAQDTGRRQVVIHDIRNLDKAPQVGDQLTIKFSEGRGRVTDMVKAGQDLGR